MSVKFMDKHHQDFFTEKCIENEKYGGNDCHYMSLFYLLGMSHTLRTNFQAVYNMKERRVIPTSVEEGFQTTGSRAITKLAINLFTDTTPFDYDYSAGTIFASAGNYFEYLFEALKIRYRGV